MDLQLQGKVILVTGGARTPQSAALNKQDSEPDSLIC
jgi:hypothetical protein